MDLASGYSDSINYGNGYTPLANNAINNNNAAFAQQQAAMAAYAQAMQNNVFASGGGFGQQTADYAGAGAAYGRATGGFTGGGGYPSGDVQRGPDLPNLSTTPDPFGAASRGWDGSVTTPESSALMLQDPAAYYRRYGGGDSSSFADRYSAAPPIDYRLQPTPAQQLPQGIYDGMFAPSTPRSVIGTPQPQQPDPATGIPIMNQGGDAPYGGALPPFWQGVRDWTGMGPAQPTAESAALMLQSPAAYYAKYGGSSTQTPAPFGGPDTNTYGYPGSGSLGTGTAFGGYQPDTPSGRGGIGSDAVRDQMAWLLAQQSPYAGPGIPSNGPYPNLGYNPGMANSFANPTMQQYDWTANNAKLQQQMQDALRTIDQSTGRQPEQPYGGQLPSFWQGVRDWTGMGQAQATPQQGWQEGR